MVLGKLPGPGRPTNLDTVGQGGAGGGCLDIFTLLCPFSPLSPSLLETARYRLKYCLKGPLNPKQPTNQLPWLKLKRFFYFVTFAQCFVLDVCHLFKDIKKRPLCPLSTNI